MDRFSRTPSADYLAARNALARLASIESCDRADRAYASAVAQDKARHLAELLGGVKESRGHPCFARLVGRRCRDRSWHSMHDDGYADQPPCSPPGTDHGKLWVRRREAVAYTSEPYGLCLKTIKEIIAFAERWGVDVHIDADPSPHFPGRTVLVLYRAKPFVVTAAPPAAE